MSLLSKIIPSLVSSNFVVRRMTQTSINRCNLVAVLQLTSTHDMEDNYKICKDMIIRAKKRGAAMVFLPECFDYVGRNKDETINMAIDINGEYIGRFRKLAKENDIWLSLGGFHQVDPNKKVLPFNNHCIIDNEGITRGEYQKLHLFDLEIPGKVKLLESEFNSAGKTIPLPVETPIGKVAMNICYDVRFPELGLIHRKNGAEILTYPSAFTVPTGLAHWESLLRARAIETQSYVIAAAQTGSHNPKRSSYGHAMIVDPWGAVIGQASDTVDICFGEINLDYLQKVRQNQPVFDHRRKDIYMSKYTYAFVNIRPIVKGHVLICPIRYVKRLSDLTDEETCDIFLVAKKIQTALEKYLNSTACTISCQDGIDAGQSVEHVHIHILPRNKDDFGDTPDAIYKEILEHDKDGRVGRSDEEMSREADEFRKLFYTS
ncbi:Nitrilase homolog 1 [Strongyloides ratti]|uniref:Nitrilase and fragile histidine triad fusion protein NitFhit n=1 Tax=Strongyloides ratti TaxID=34506 RepID=A0A090MZ71_STRRB|nr:Nitrilase homolog 1 [Strongyloides ratti]CEF68424.1 Nitrilase homolog 1 [Strongyloides ratti]